MMRPPVLAALLLLSGGAAHARQDEGPVAPMVVTTVTGTYCLSLWQQIRDHGVLPRQVRDLQTEGRELCRQGQVRGGINRLRRALMVLRNEHKLGDAQAQAVGDPPQPAVPAEPHG